MNLSFLVYLAQPGTNGDFILMHSVSHTAREREVDTLLNYADYYYLEALKRYIAMRNGDENISFPIISMSPSELC